MRASLKTLLIASLAAACATTSFEVSNSRAKPEPEVLRRVLEQLASGHGELLVLDQVPARERAVVVQRAEDVLEDLESHSVRLFVSRNREGGIHDALLAVPGRIRLISFEQKSAAWPDADCEAGWKRLRQAFPGSAGLVSLSRVGFNHDRTQALVHVDHQKSCVEGSAAFYELQKSGGQWHVVAVVPVRGDAELKRFALPASTGGDSFVASARDPAWLSERVQAANARRRELASRYSDERLGRCASYEAEKNRVFEEVPYNEVQEHLEAASAKTGFDNDGMKYCAMLGARYFRPRVIVFENMFEEMTRGRPSTQRDGVWTLDAFLRERRPAERAALERSLSAFAEVRDARFGRDGCVPVVNGLTPGRVKEDVRNAINRAALAVASESFVRQYVESVARLKRDPRSFRQPRPNFGMFTEILDPRRFDLAAQEAARTRFMEAKSEALEASGVSSSENALFEALRDAASQRRKAPRSGDAASGVNENVWRFFDEHEEAIAQQLKDARTDAALARYRPKPVSFPTKGAVLRVTGTHPDTDDALAPFALRIHDPDGRVTWSCGKPYVVEGQLEAPCLLGRGVFTRKGEHLFSLERDGVPAVSTTMKLDGRELSVEVAVDGDKNLVEVTRVYPAPAGVVLELGETFWHEEVSFTLTNGSATPLVPVGSGWKDAARLAYVAASGWKRHDAAPLSVPDNGSLPSGERAVFRFGTLHALAGLPTLRVVTRLRAGDESSGKVWEVWSSPLPKPVRFRSRKSYTPECIAKPRHPSSIFPADELTDVIWRDGHALGLRGSTVVRLDGSSIVPLFDAKEPLRQLISTAEGGLVVRGKDSVFASSDGQAFWRLELPFDDPRLIVSTGDAVLIGGRDGSLVRMNASGSVSGVSVSVLATWHAGSFDGRFGAVISGCGRLLVSENGGATWQVRTSPRARDLVVRDGAIFVSTSQGVFRSIDAGQTFEKLLEASCRRFSTSTEPLLVICTSTGEVPSPLFRWSGSGRFIPIPVEVSLPVSSVAVDEQGRVAAVGRSDTLLWGTVEGVRPMTHSSSARESLAHWLQEQAPFATAPRLVKPPAPAQKQP